MSKKDESETPSISIEVLASALAKAMKDSGPSASILTGMSQERIDRVMGKFEKPIKSRRISGKSPETYATFDMIVLESRSKYHPYGRVVRLENYKHPKEAYELQSNGGLLPDGASIWRDAKPQGTLSDETPGTFLTPFFKQWRYDTFWKQDLMMIASGKPLRVECCLDGHVALETPWEDTNLWSDDNQNAAE